MRSEVGEEGFFRRGVGELGALFIYRKQEETNAYVWFSSCTFAPVHPPYFLHILLKSGGVAGCVLEQITDGVASELKVSLRAHVIR